MWAYNNHKTSKEVYMIGAQLGRNRGCELGYWKTPMKICSKFATLKNLKVMM